MKKLIILFVDIVLHRGNNAHNAALQTATAREHKTKRSIVNLPLVERTILIIMKFETLHSLKHPSYCGYGHRSWPGEKLPRQTALTEREANALLRKDFAKLCAMYSHLGKDSVLAATLAYNIGPGAVNKSTFFKKLKRGDSNIFKAYTSHCRYKGKFHKGLYKGRFVELTALFIQ